jgi:hypothetical protein
MKKSMFALIIGVLLFALCLPVQFFISSRVSAHIVRFFSGRLAKGQVSISEPLNFR